ncbi:hypothetical protein LCI18_010314 [Fusarium solani-melongenae]|uniref:Uncharacterized protein n=1 Tax=Fusarium solani subsp. cucurbitae TaxID=2747967 RepID=A0ACD3ZDN7_FUSSC|nr:hypothetical protein LCI18_010314 [Fusarium solani-melongenae]
MASSSPVWLVTGAGTGFGEATALSALKRGHRVVATARRLSVLSDLVNTGAHAMVLDVTIPEDDIATRVGEARNVYGRLDYLVNSAAYWAVSGFTEALAAELKPFGIVVTSVEPGQFRTAFLNADKRKTSARRMDVYANTGAEEYRTLLDAVDNNQPGDVDRGAGIVVDVLTTSSVAEGKEVPVRLVLGKDCLDVVRSKCESTLKLMNEWEGVAVSTDRIDVKL